MILRMRRYLVRLKNYRRIRHLALRHNSKAASLETVQRLFSIFPMGPVGVALVILRFSAAAVLISYWLRNPLLSTAFTRVALVLPIGALFLGVLTPYASTIGCLIEFALIIRSGAQQEFALIIAIVNTAVVGILGPGAYSLDAWIFGRKIISFPGRNE
jgi:hypothetical protein